MMPFCWDGLDNATRIHETGYGLRLPRYTWKDADLIGAIDRLLGDGAMRQRLARLSGRMRSADGRGQAAAHLNRLLESRSRERPGS